MAICLRPTLDENHESRCLHVLRAAIVGMAHPHSPAWVQTLEQLKEDVTLVAFCDADEQYRSKVPEAHRELPFYNEVSRLLKEQRPDLALVTPWTHETPEIMVDLANAGIHMLVDKPMARNASEARQALDAVKANGVRVGIGFANRLNPAVQEIRRLISTGRLGRILVYEARHISPLVSLMPNGAQNPLYSQALSGGGHLHWLGIHYLDLMLYLSSDKVTSVSAMTPNLLGLEMDVEDCATLSLRFQGGALGSLISGNLNATFEIDQFLAVRGEKGQAVLVFNEPGHAKPTHRLRVVLNNDGAPDVQESLFTVSTVPGYGRGGLDIAQDLVGAIRDDRETVIPLDAVADALEIIDAAYESSRTGTQISLS